MSRASQWAATVSQRPRRFVDLCLDCSVDEGGRFLLRVDSSTVTLSPIAALALRDWLTDTFDEGAGS